MTRAALVLCVLGVGGLTLATVATLWLLVDREDELAAVGIGWRR